MNDAHLHLILNHFPIIGLFFGFGILVIGIIKKNALLLNVAYIMFIICMVLGKASMFTGEKAEHMLEKSSAISHELIHEHEEHAELLMKFLYLLGISSIVGFYLNSKQHNKWYLISFVIAIIAILSLIFSIEAGTTGGEITHSEIRDKC